MKAALVATYTGIRPGRERLANQVGRETDEYVNRFAAEGKCTPPKWFFGTTGPSVWFVEGEMEDLAQLAAAPDAQKLIGKAHLMLEGFTMELCPADRDLQFAALEAILDELKLG